MRGREISSGDRRTDIQQLRALAVAAVVLNHVSSVAMPGGYLGVDAFFVVSGYVITKSLLCLRRSDESRVRTFVSFWTRRMYRLWPSLFVVVTLTSIAALTLGIGTPSSAITGISSLFAVSNLRMFLGLQDYFALNTSTDWFMHTWSLSVEEQFYLAFSLIFAAVGMGAAYRSERRGVATRYRIAVVVMLALCVASVVVAILPSTTELARFYLLPARFYQPGVGVLIALVEHPRQRREGYILRHKQTLQHVSTIALVVALAVMMGLGFRQPRWGSLAVTCITALLVAVAPQSIRDSGYVRIPSVTAVGDRSYAVYLVHWPVMVLAASLTVNGVVRTAISLATTMIGAETLHRTVEKPFRDVATRLRPALALAAGILALCIPLAATSFAFGQLERRANAAAPAQLVAGAERCPLTWGESDHGRSAAVTSTTWVLGDSHSEALEPALYDVLHGDCAVVARMGPLFTAQRIGSSSSHQRAIQVAVGNPDDLISWIDTAVPPPRMLIVTHYLSAYLADPDTAPLSSDYIAVRWIGRNGAPVSRSEFISEVTSNVGRIASALGRVGARLVLTLPPPDFNWLSSPLDRATCSTGLLRPPPCVTYASESVVSLTEHRTRQRDTVALVAEVERRHRNVHHIDLSATFCSETRCSNYRNGSPLYIDDDHINARGRALLVPQLRSELRPLLTARTRASWYVTCAPFSTVYGCEIVHVSARGTITKRAIEVTSDTPDGTIITRLDHVDNFGDSYCIALDSRGKTQVTAGLCAPLTIHRVS